MTATTTDEGGDAPIDVVAVRRLAKAGGVPPTTYNRTTNTWVAPTREIAAMLRAYPGNPSFPDDDKRAGWVRVGIGDATQGPTLTQNAIRVRQGHLRPFQDTRGGMFQASVVTDPNAPGKVPGTVELWARWLTPADAAKVREQHEALNAAGTYHIVHRKVPLTPEQLEDRAERAARGAATRASRKQPDQPKPNPKPRTRMPAVDEVQFPDRPVVFSDGPA